MFQDITPPISKGKMLIEKYGNGGFVISKVKYSGSVIVFPDKVINWQIDKDASLDKEVFEILYGKELLAEFASAEVFLIGSGKEQRDISDKIKHISKENNVNIEIMDTGAACRTYNVLLAEGRDVAAALIDVE